MHGAKRLLHCRTLRTQACPRPDLTFHLPLNTAYLGTLLKHALKARVVLLSPARLTLVHGRWPADARSLCLGVAQRHHVCPLPAGGGLCRRVPCRGVRLEEVEGGEAEHVCAQYLWMD